MAKIPGRVPAVAKNGAADAVLEAIKDGHTISTAAAHAGVSRRTIHNWLKLGREALEMYEDDPNAEPLTPYDEEYMQFYFDYEAAGAVAKKVLLDRIWDAGEKSWQANAWILKNRWPEEFGNSVKVEHTKTEHKKISINIKGRPPLEAIEDNRRMIQSAEYEVIE